MKLLLDNKEYEIISDNEPMARSLEGMLPLQMKLQRSGEHEYYAALPEELDVTGAKSTSHVKAGGVYYFKAWKAFALNFKEMDISPYSVYVIGEVPGIAEILETSKQTVEVSIRV